MHTLEHREAQGLGGSHPSSWEACRASWAPWDHEDWTTRRTVQLIELICNLIQNENQYTIMNYQYLNLFSITQTRFIKSKLLLSFSFC